MQLYSVKDYAELKGVTERSVRRWIQEEKVKAHKNDKGEWLIEDENEELSFTSKEVHQLRSIAGRVMVLYWQQQYYDFDCPFEITVGKTAICDLYGNKRGYETAAECRKNYPRDEPVRYKDRYFPECDKADCSLCFLEQRITRLEDRMKKLFQPKKRPS